jgi:uncharacterized membrane protein YhaH (DUF805 family)
MQILKSYAARFGRMSRATLLGRLCILALACTSAGMLAEWAFGETGAALVALVFVWCALAMSAQRLHDRGRSGLWLLIGLVPVAGPLWLLWQLLGRGDEGANFYGDNPAVRGDYLQVDISR